MVDTVTLAQATSDTMVNITVGPSASDIGGSVNITAGASESNNGGEVIIASGTGGSGFNAGSISIAPGPCIHTDSGQGGSVSIVGGGSANDNGGAVSIAGGTSTGSGHHGGHVLIAGGAGYGGGGDIVLTAGSSTGGSIGHLQLVGLEAFADDSAATAGGVPVNGLYRTANVIKIRVA